MSEKWSKTHKMANFPFAIPERLFSLVNLCLVTVVVTYLFCTSIAEPLAFLLKVAFLQLLYASTIYANESFETQLLG